MRIASLLSAGTEIVCGLGLRNNLVGISHECDYPLEITNKPRLTRALIDDSAASADIDWEVRERLSQGLALYEIDGPQLVQLRPNVIITQSQCEVCAISETDLRKTVATHKELADSRIVTLNPLSLEDVFRDITSVARATDSEDKGESYIQSLRERLDRVRELSISSATNRRPRVICIEWTSPLMVAANWMPDLVEIAGGENGITVAGSHSGVVEWQAICDFDPEVLIVAPCGFNLERAASSITEISRLLEWDSIDAAKNDRVFACDGNALFNRSGPRLIDTTELISGLLHGDAGKNYRNRYKSFWNLAPNA